MITPTLPELLTPVTAAEYRAQFLAQLSALGFPITSWEPDGVANNLIEVMSQVFAAQSQMAYPMIAGGFLDSAAQLKNADGSENQTWLALLAWNVYGIVPLAPTVASGHVELVNTSSVPVIVAPGDVRVVNPAGYTYTSSTGGTVPAQVGVTPGTLVVTVQADQPGSTGTALVGDLSLLTPILGISATNIEDLVGTDGESNAALAARCRQRLAVLSPNGSAAAYQYCLETADDGNGSLGISRVKVMPASGTGAVDCWVQNAAGTLTDADPQIPAALAYVLAKCTPDSVTPNVQAAPPNSIQVVAQYTTTSGAAIASTVFESALTSYFSSLPIGGLAGPGDPVTVCPLSGIVATLQSVAGVAGVRVTTPSADVPLLVGSTPYVAIYSSLSTFTKV